MTDTAEAKLFMSGGSQAVRLPRAFRLPGSKVRVRRVGRAILLEPVEQTPAEISALFDALAALRDIPFMPDGREQPDP
jgi:antitoxin VapB